MGDLTRLARVAVTPKRGKLPVYLIHHVTDRCNARCRHCFIIHDGSYAAPDGVTSGSALTLDEIMRLVPTLGPNLYTVQLTGGEPFLRADLVGIARAYFERSSAAYVQICTNGMFTDRIVELAEMVLAEDRRRRLGFVISLDDIGEAHDLSRGVRGMFDAAVASLRALEQLQRVFPALQVSVNVTVSKFNEDRLLDIYEHLTAELGISNVMCTLARGCPSDPTACEVDPEKYRAFVNRCAAGWQAGDHRGFGSFIGAEVVNAQNVVTRRKNLALLDEPKYRDRCYAGDLSGVLYADGTVAACEVLPYVIGNVRDHGLDFTALWRGEVADVVRRRRDATKCFCTHECFAVCNTIFNPRNWVELGDVIVRHRLNK